ncbi:MAG: hypothetical protein KDA37_10895 [Planctomycetales bacterium]|nr:hypothetical protein [Planctomycetales bacterium]
MPPPADNSENPFAAPESEPSPAPDEAPELYGRVPGSVLLAITSLAGILVLNALVVLAAVFDSDEVTVIVFLAPLLLGGLILGGIVRRSRQSRVAARILSLLGGVLGVLWIGIAVVQLFIVLYSSVDQPQHISPSSIAGIMAIGLSISCLPVAMLWTVFLALGRPTALSFFGLICPGCHARRSRPADLWYRTLRCKVCGQVWS